MWFTWPGHFCCSRFLNAKFDQSKNRNPYPVTVLYILLVCVCLGIRCTVMIKFTCWRNVLTLLTTHRFFHLSYKQTAQTLHHYSPPEQANESKTVIKAWFMESWRTGQGDTTREREQLNPRSNGALCKSAHCFHDVEAYYPNIYYFIPLINYWKGKAWHHFSCSSV